MDTYLIELNMNYPIHKKEADEHPVVSLFFYSLFNKHRRYKSSF